MSVGKEYQIHLSAGVRTTQYRQLSNIILSSSVNQVNFILAKLADVVIFDLIYEHVCWLKISSASFLLKRALYKLSVIYNNDDNALERMRIVHQDDRQFHITLTVGILFLFGWIVPSVGLIWSNGNFPLFDTALVKKWLTMF